MFFLKVFEIVPADFFSVLVSPNREIYADALMKLYEMFQSEINIRLKAFLAEVELLLEDREYILEEGDEAEDSEPSSLRGKARLVVRRLVKTGWIDREFLDGSFTEIIIPNTYAITVMRMLKELTDESVAEYDSLVFSAYSALNQAYTDNRDRMYEALIVAKNNTEKLDFKLRTFYYGIRGYQKVIRENTDVNLLLKNHFEAYKEALDRVYHPIKTMDSFTRYSGPIRGILTDIRFDDALLDEMAAKAMATKAKATKEYADQNEAHEDILKTIEAITDSYGAVSVLLDEIDIKHSKMTKQSIEKIRYVMSADQTIKGKLVELLKAYAAADDEQAPRIMSMLEEGVTVNRQEYIDAGSLYHKNIRSRRSDEPPQPIEEERDIEKEILTAVVGKLRSGYSDARVKSYMDSLFANGRTEVASEEISVENDTDYILTLLSVVSAYSGTRGYRIEITDGYAQKGVYRIPRFVLKKGGKR